MNLPLLQIRRARNENVRPRPRKTISRRQAKATFQAAKLRLKAARKRAKSMKKAANKAAAQGKDQWKRWNEPERRGKSWRRGPGNKRECPHDLGKQPTEITERIEEENCTAPPA